MIRCLPFLLSAALLLPLGCRGSGFTVSTVEGAVTVDGEPVTSGSLSFLPLESKTGQPIAADIKDGKYRSDSVPRGKLMVMITAMKDVGEKHVEFGIEYPKLKNVVPEKYRSGIELTVDAPKLTHNFELTSK